MSAGVAVTTDAEAGAALNCRSCLAIAERENTAVPTTAAMEKPKTTPAAVRLRAFRRIGFSTSAYDTHDSTNAPTSRPSLTPSESSWPTYWPARISTGQCQR